MLRLQVWSTLICLTVSKSECWVFFTPLYYPDQFFPVLTEKKHTFSINISTNLYFYGLLGLEKHISHVSSKICHAAAKWAEKSPVKVKDRKQTSFICCVDKRLFPVRRRKYVEGVRNQDRSSLYSFRQYRENMEDVCLSSNQQSAWIWSWGR